MFGYLEYAFASGNCNPHTLNDWDDDLRDAADKIVQIYNYSFDIKDIARILDKYDLSKASRSVMDYLENIETLKFVYDRDAVLKDIIAILKKFT